MRPQRLIALLALAALPLAAGGCGTSAADQANLRKIRALTTEFAAAHGPRACHMLTGSDVVKVYGGGGNPPPTIQQARAKCVKASVAFKGEPITITNAQIISPTVAKVNAENHARTFTYAVTFHRGTTKKPWKIDDVSQYKVKP